MNKIPSHKLSISKNLQCECGIKVISKLIIGEKELLDGYHGECPYHGWLFEAVNIKPKKKGEAK